MKEHIRQRGKTWTYWLDVGKDENGKRRQLTKGGFATEKDARAAARKVLVKIEDAGSYSAPTKDRLAPFMLRWLDSTRSSIRPSTHAMYKALIDAHINPRLGALELRKLTPAKLNTFYGDLLADGRKDGKGGLSQQTVFKIHATLRKALAAAVKWGDLPRNVADLADPPKGKVTGTKMHTWTASEVGAFLSFVAEDRLYAAYLLLVTTGLRRGELLGLRWKAVDLDAKRIAVHETIISINYKVAFSTPKTARGRRSVALDEMTAQVLREHRRRQVEERTTLGMPWPTADDLLFSNLEGEPLQPSDFSDRFDRLVKNSKLPRIRLHDLRHTHATLALQAGIAAKVVSERLGHSTVSMTLDTYSHVIPSLEEEAADKVAALVFGGSR